MQLVCHNYAAANETMQHKMPTFFGAIYYDSKHQQRDYRQCLDISDTTNPKLSCWKSTLAAAI